jgi:hypothetical protein
MGQTVPGGKYIDGENYVDAEGRILGKAPEQDRAGVRSEKTAQQVQDEAQRAQQDEYNALSAADIVERIRSGRLSAGDAQRLEEGTGKNRATVAEAIKAAQAG